MTNFEFCRDSIHSKTTESCILLFLCTLATTHALCVLFEIKKDVKDSRVGPGGPYEGSAVWPKRRSKPTAWRLVLVFVKILFEMLITTKLWKTQLSPGQKLKNPRRFVTALLLSSCKNRFCLWRFVKNLNSTKRGVFFRHFFCFQDDHFCACTRKWCDFSYFSKSFRTKKSFKNIRPKMTKVASRGSCLKSTRSRPRGFVQCLSHIDLQLTFRQWHAMVLQ